MARIQLLIADAPQRMTLHAMLEAAGHSMVDTSADVVFTDSVESAVKHAGSSKTFVRQSRLRRDRIRLRAAAARRSRPRG